MIEVKRWVREGPRQQTEDERKELELKKQLQEIEERKKASSSSSKD